MRSNDQHKSIGKLGTCLLAILCSIAFGAWQAPAAAGDLDPAKRASAFVGTITVTNTNDSGAGSLRQAIADAAPGDTINFSVTGTITLTSGRLVIDKNLTIQGPGASLLSISGNDASSVFHITHGGINVTLDGMTIRNGLGDGIINRGTLIVSNSIVTQNGASGISGNGSINVRGSTISANAHSGINADAGCYFPPYLSVSNSTISGNGRTGINNYDGLAEIANSTIVGNRGGILSIDDCQGAGGTTRLWNTIVAGNTMSTPDPYGVSGTDIFGKAIAAASHNLVGDPAYSGGIQNGVNGNIVGVNPLLGPLRNNGGPTLTLGLRPGSPAIDKGSNCVLTAGGCGDSIPALTNDQRGQPRNGTVDIGAFERQPGEPSFNAPFDYDGDGRTDISVYRPSTGTWYVARSQTSDMYVRRLNTIDPQGHFLTIGIRPADYDGDAKTDISEKTCNYIFDQSCALTEWVVLSSSTNTIFGFEYYSGPEFEFAVPADYNGDGAAELATWSNGSWGAWNQGFIAQWGLPGDKPVPADFDGDGRAEVAVWRPSEGKWYVANILTGAITTVNWGVDGDIPVVGDYNGDGRADFAVYRPSNNTWYRLHSNDYSIQTTQWGQAGDIVTPGDYDGDGRIDAAVFRPSEGKWYVLTAANAIITSSFGQEGDMPTPAAYID